MVQVGEKIKRLREDRKWSQPHLAVKAGVAVSAVSQIENGRRSPNVGTLNKLAEAFGVEVADFFRESEAPKVTAPLSSQAPNQDDEERREELRIIREVLKDTHALFEELAAEYKSTGNSSKLTTLASVAMFSIMGAEQFVEDEVGPAEDRASTRVYTAGARLEEFVEDLLETIQSMTTETVGAEVAYLDAHRRRRVS